jgi:hypothetical protein
VTNLVIFSHKTLDEYDMDQRNVNCIQIFLHIREVMVKKKVRLKEEVQQLNSKYRRRCPNKTSLVCFSLLQNLSNARGGGKKKMVLRDNDRARLLIIYSGSLIVVQRDLDPVLFYLQYSSDWMVGLSQQAYLIGGSELRLGVQISL